VDHVHFHIIPKDEHGGLGIGWKAQKPTQDELKQLAQDLIEKIAKL
jgi:diadenosine tetraphosphate (Ap4A) HIT family hydrolase